MDSLFPFVFYANFTAVTLAEILIRWQRNQPQKANSPILSSASEGKSHKNSAKHSDQVDVVT